MDVIGVVRRMDDLGRVCLPKEFRKVLGLNPGDAVDMVPTSEGIILRPYKAEEPDFDTVAKVLDAMCGKGNYILFDAGGMSILPIPNMYEMGVLDATPICYDGECIGYISTSPEYAKLAANVVVALLCD